MRQLLRFLKGFTKNSPTLIEVRISKKALRKNYQTFSLEYELPVAPVLKSNAYGHGLVEIAKILQEEKPPFFVVDSYHEAVQLRSCGIVTPLLVIGYVTAAIIGKNTLRDVSFVLTSLEGIAALQKIASTASVHIKLDTGMHRQGVLLSEVEEAIKLLKSSSLQVVGICSHFASAENDAEFTRAQIKVWNELVHLWRKAYALTYWHIAATAGSVYVKEVESNVLRLGAGLYGFGDDERIAKQLEPVLSLHSLITLVKHIGASEGVGYNHIFIAPKAMRIAIVPVGYFEGLDRRLSNKGSMVVGGVVCPIVGRVSMNMSAIDVSNNLTVQLETPVLVMSNIQSDPNSIRNLSVLCDMSPLEFMVHIPQHLRRVVV